MTGARGSIGRLGDSDAAPVLAGSPEGFGLVWLRQVTGFEQDVLVVGAQEMGGEIVFGRQAEIPTTTRAFAYAPVLTEIGGGVYFVAWTEGEASPMFQIHGRFIEL